MFRNAVTLTLLSLLAGAYFGCEHEFAPGGLLQLCIWKSMLNGNYEQASRLVSFDLSLSFSRKSSDDVWNRTCGDNLLLLRRYNDAKSVLERSLGTKCQTSLYVHSLLANAYLGLHQYKDAAKVTSTPADMPVDSFDLAQFQIAHGKAMICIGDIDAAVRSFELAQGTLGDKRFADLYIKLARLKTGDSTDAQVITNQIFAYWHDLNGDPETSQEFDYLHDVLTLKNCPQQAHLFATAANSIQAR